MITLTEIDILSAKAMSDLLFSLPMAEYDAVCDAYPLETTLPILVSAGLVTELSEQQHALLDVAPLRIERFLDQRVAA